MKEYGLIGFPLEHSFSKKFFTDKFVREKINASYTNFEVPKAEMLLEIVREHPNLCGLNCTIPHKESIIPHLDEIDTDAQKIGAVNVIKIIRTNLESKAYKLVGYNSDIIGFTDSISPLLKPHHKKALVLGTGGAAKAIATGLKKLKITSTYASRTAGEEKLTYTDITTTILQDYDIIVNCTPIGMYPNINEAPPIPYEALNEKHLLYDLTYNPKETLFLKKGKKQGCTVKNGQEMLELQALASWKIWTE